MWAPGTLISYFSVDFSGDTFIVQKDGCCDVETTFGNLTDKINVFEIWTFNNKIVHNDNLHKKKISENLTTLGNCREILR